MAVPECVRVCAPVCACVVVAAVAAAVASVGPAATVPDAASGSVLTPFPLRLVRDEAVLAIWNTSTSRQTQPLQE